LQPGWPQLFYDTDADLEPSERQKTVAIIGYGSPGATPTPFNLKGSRQSALSGGYEGSARWERPRRMVLGAQRRELMLQGGLIMCCSLMQTQKSDVYAAEIRGRT